MPWRERWFELTGGMVDISFISVVDSSSRSKKQLKDMCASDNNYSHLFRGREGLATGEQCVSLCTGNHVSSNAPREGKTLVCLDAEARVLSVYFDGRLYPVIRDVPIPGHLAVWSKFRGHAGTLDLRTGILPLI